MNNPEKVDPVIPCIDVCRVNIHFDGILDKLKLIIVVKGEFQNN